MTQAQSASTQRAGERAKNARRSAGDVQVSATPEYSGRSQGKTGKHAGSCTKNDQSCYGRYSKRNGEPVGMPA